jgi:small ligand-binding sensory domain FIST
MAPMMVGWYIIRMCYGSSFADNHAHIVATVSAFISACALAGFLAAIAAAARKKALHERRLATTAAFGGCPCV